MVKQLSVKKITVENRAAGTVHTEVVTNHLQPKKSQEGIVPLFVTTV